MENIKLIYEKGILLDGRYKLLQPLSSDGGTADVWLAVDTFTIDEVYDDESDQVTTDEESGIKVAIKIYRPQNALVLGEQLFRDEFKIVFNCHHSKLVQPINFSIYEGIPYLVMPYCRNGSSERLQGKIKGNKELWRYISDVSAGLAYLHAFNPTIVHHDIKPANILINDDNSYAITDFGISSHSGLNRDGYDNTNSGTMAYMAPERFNDDYESIPESDIWSFGATLYELITGKVPYGDLGGKAQLDSQIPPPPLPANVSKDIKRLVSDCLSLDPKKRPSAQAIQKAAQASQYPIHKTKLYVIGGAVALIGILLLLMIPKEKKNDVSDIERSQIEISDDEKFSCAIDLINTNDPDSVLKGMKQLEVLGASGYIPAIYEQAYTYGWYSDSASLARKKLLGVEVYAPNTPNTNLPISKSINTKAVGLFAHIEELSDPQYPKINADALYRLASYYIATDKVFAYDPARAKELLTHAKEWAVQCNDTLLIRRIDQTLKQLNKKAK